MEMNDIETSASENPEWEKARKALEKLNQDAGGSKVSPSMCTLVTYTQMV